MKKNNKSKITFLCLITILTPFYICKFNFNLLDINDDVDEVSLENLKKSEYSSYYQGSGVDINVSLQQSLIDSATTEIFNISDPNNNRFHEPCPTVGGFKSSFINITIEDIYAPNKTIIIEDKPTGWHSIANSQVAATSFEVPAKSYLTGLSTYVGIDDVQDDKCDLVARVLNSTWVNGVNEPDDDIAMLCSAGQMSFSHFIGWLDNYSKVFSPILLDPSKTTNDTFYIELRDNGLDSDGMSWRMALDNPPTNPDNTLSYVKSGANWSLIEAFGDYYDLNLILNLTPFNSYSNEELIIQDSVSWANPSDFTNFRPSVSSFIVERNCFLTNISVYLENSDTPNNATIKMVLYNATWNPINSTFIPGGYNINDFRIIANFNFSGDDEWYTVKNIKVFLNNSKTENNTWFIGLWDQNEATANARWWYVRDGTGGDNNDKSISMRWDSFYMIWEEIEDFFETVDFGLKIGLDFDKNIPKPEDIGLRINNTAVIGNDNIQGFGNWNSTQSYSSPSGQLEFVIFSDWWDVSCKISQVQINYIKEDIKATSVYRILGSEQYVEWNISRNDGLNLFDTRLNNYEINFSIPTFWDRIHVFNGPINKTDDLLISPNNNGYKSIQVVNAGNGTYWHLTAISENLLSSIDTSVNSVATEIALYSDIVDFKAMFKEFIAQNDGIINLSVYNPFTIDNNLIFTSFNSSFASDIEFYLGSWNISDTVTNYGEYRIQVSWNNNTAAGFSEKILTVIGEAELTLITPNQDALYYSNQSFNIIVYCLDSNQLNAIDGATIYYNIDGQGWQSTSSNNGTIGYYIIPVNCNVFTINGAKAVEITLSKVYYENQTLDYNFYVIIVEENGKQEESPLIIIAIISTVGGIGVMGVIVIVLIKRRRTNATN